MREASVSAVGLVIVVGKPRQWRILRLGRESSILNIFGWSGESAVAAGNCSETNGAATLEPVSALLQPSIKLERGVAERV